MKVLKRIGIGFLIFIGILLVAAGGYVGYMQAHYYRIKDHKPLAIGNNQKTELRLHHPYTATTYNVSFGAYNHDVDFFMDHGELKMVRKRMVGAERLFLNKRFSIQLMA
ncbi:hypothetical protein EJK17_02230 [Lactobacillus xujianguonis]|uniref:Uncharacterized protein n=1 Tax=Lactobacillus xujianguonis TaxID=2495899 RepID=A0A437SX95_9LACO|nr:hypothetical protein EJK17_02230 [Lactobacillus xujianguonis]RVU76726.1 hypothetical protein EJK20_04390 [Lactobacillus xujianguonis]